MELRIIVYYNCPSVLTKLLFKMATKTGDELLEELELFIDSWMVGASLINLKLLAQFSNLGASAEKYPDWKL